MVCCFQTFLLFVFRRRGTPAWCEVSIALFSHGDGDEDEDEVGDDYEEQVVFLKCFTAELKLKKWLRTYICTYIIANIAPLGAHIASTTIGNKDA